MKIGLQQGLNAEYKGEIADMCGSRKFCQRGSNSDNVFLVVQGGEDQNITISGPFSALNAGFVFQHIRTSIAKKPFIFAIFQGGSDPLSPLLSTIMQLNDRATKLIVLL